MDKNSIKKYAVWARQELISRVTQKADYYGITREDTGTVGAESIEGRILTASERRQRDALIWQIRKDGYEQVMEEVAYTWFNRFCALRYMEVNGYLPSHVRVFTDDEGAFKPQILTEAINLELTGLDMEKVFALKNENKTEALFRYLLITQCNALNEILPGMFQKIEDYTELLLPENLLREGSVIEQMIALIPEEDWTDQVQIIGWLYQYYNSEKKDEVFAALKNNVKITKENIPAATQLFTPDWIVRYMVENSLGRLWVEGHPNDELKSNWKYYLEEAEQEPEVQAQLAEIRKAYAALNPQDIKVIDPCMGSGHILVYLFDVLMQIYESFGYSTRDAAKMIVENNLYGLDIDDRAAQLAFFAVMMKARSYDSRFFRRGCQPKVYAIRESNGISAHTLDYFENGNPELHTAMTSILEDMQDAKEYGSILTVRPVDFDALYNRFDEIHDEFHMERTACLEELLPLVQVAETLAQKYLTVVTNPPYMGGSGMNDKLSNFVKRNYPDSKADFSSVFVERCNLFSESKGNIGLVTPQSWLFLVAFQKFRAELLSKFDFLTLLHLGTGAFDSGFGTTAFVISRTIAVRYNGVFFDLRKGKDSQRKVEMLCNHEGEIINQSSLFRKLPNNIVAYWCTPRMRALFSSLPQIKDSFALECGIKNGNNEKFLRLWFEVDHEKLNCSDVREKCFANMHHGKKWFKCNKGGGYQKWYGSYEYVLNLEHDAEQIKRLVPASTYRLRNHENYFIPTITWPLSGGSKFGCRYMDIDTLPDVNANIIVLQSVKAYCLLAYMNSCVFESFLNMLNPTINFPIDSLARVPYKELRDECIAEMTKTNISLSRTYWNSFETSWDFTEHPLVRCSKGLWDSTSVACTIDYYYGYLPKVSGPLELCYLLWQGECNERFKKLKANEEKLNRIFIDIYDLQDELTPEVEDKDVTVRKADLQRDIKSLISYAVGCMFGRYSLNVPGLVLAGQAFDDRFKKDPMGYQFGDPAQLSGNYVADKDGNLVECSFFPDQDNIIPISDDEYFEDDIVGRFVKFIETVYGKESLDSNLKFIADALGGKGQPKQVIRNYFLNDFFADHCRVYQKRPIYWLFDSGKKGGFKALIYMHRYAPDTIARIRTDYVHEQQGRYRTAIDDLENRIASADTGSRVKLNKQLSALRDKDTELRGYEEKIHHLADQMIAIDLDDGVKVNYEKFKDVLAKIK